MPEKPTYEELERRILDLERTVHELKQARDVSPAREKSLSKSIEILDRIFNQTHFLIAYMDRDFNFIRVNKAYAEASRRPAEDFPGKNHFDLYPHEENENIFRRVVETGEPHTATAKPFEHPDQPERGTTYWDFTLNPTFDDHGEIDGVLFTLVDVTARKRSEEALQESEERYRSFVLNFQGIAFRGKMDFTPIFTHGAVEEITGYTEDEFVAGKPRWDQVIHSDDLRALLLSENVKKLRSVPGYSCERDYRIVRKDGSIRWVHELIRNVCGGDGRPSMVQGAIHDITDRKRAEEKLIESEERLGIILDSMPDMVLQIDADMGILWANKAALALNGNAIGQTCHSAFPGRISVCEGCPAHKSLETGEIETRVIYQPDSKTAGESYWENIGVPLKDGKGEVASVIEISRNITDRILAEKKQRRIRKAESLNRMAGAVAHKFNNQLCMVIGNLEMALEDSPPDSPRRRNLIEALLGATRSAEISRLMLNCLGYGTDKGMPIDLSDACRRNLLSLQGLMTDGIAFETDLMDSGPVVRAFSAQMKDVLTGLIANAIEAIGDNGGKISLKTGIATKIDIPVSNLVPADWKPDEEEYAFVEVEDTGCGIASEHLEEIFDPFFSTKFTGRGLGLAVVLGIVKQWDGAIDVESGKGRGTTFRVFFPLVDPEFG